MGSHCLLQGITLTKGLNLGLLHHRQILYLLSHQGSPGLLLNIKKVKNSLEKYVYVHIHKTLSIVSGEVCG